MVNIDTHKLSRALVFGAGAHSLAHLGFTGEKGKSYHNYYAGKNRNDGHIGNVQLSFEKAYTLVSANVEEVHREVLGGCAPKKLGSVLEEIADTYGGNQNGKGGRLTQRLVSQSFDHNAQNGAKYHCQQYADKGRQIETVYGEKAYVSADHYNVAVGEVKHFCNTVNHCVAQCYYSIDAAQTESGDNVAEEGHIPHLFLSFLINVSLLRNSTAAEQHRRILCSSSVAAEI